MMLHMIHSTPMFEQCRALLAADDTLLVMDPGVIENEPERFADLPCPGVLSESNTPVTDATVEAGIARQISIADWVQLTCQHPHNMVWAEHMQRMCDDNGFLLDRNDWTPDIAAAFAAEKAWS